MGLYTASGRDYDTVTEIEIPADVHDISSDVFSRFKNLKRVILPDGLTDFGSFAGLEQLEEVVLPDSIISIEDEAFYNCRSLKALTIPKSVSYIGKCPFYGNGIEELTFLGLESLTRVEHNAFAGVRSIKYNIPDCAEKRTVEYTADMGTPNLVAGYRERAKGKSLFEQAKALTMSRETFKSELCDYHPYISTSTYSPSSFISAFANTESFIVDDGVIVGYNVYKRKGDGESTVPLLIGVPTSLSCETFYSYTGDNNGAGYKGEDDDSGYTKPLYTLLYEIGHNYPSSDSFDQYTNADPVSN